MRKIGSFKTSLGLVTIAFDTNDLVEQKIRGLWCERRTFLCTTKFEWLAGKEHIKSLYDVGLFHEGEIAIIADEDFWFTIELRDSYHGSPEYLLNFDG